MRFVLPLALVCYALDQLTKWLVIARVPFDSGFEVIPNFFALVHYGNTGAAFSFLSGKNWFFVVISIVALIVLTVLFRRGAFPDRWTQTALGLLAGGILGNLTDRLVHGHVVDFLLFDLHVPLANPWPAFNVADSCICVAVGLLVLHSFLYPPQAKTATS